MTSYTNTPICDLRHLTVEAAREIESITNASLVILPKDGSPELISALEAIEKTNVAATVYLGVNDEVSVKNGMCTLCDGDFNTDGTTVMVINGLGFAKRLSKETKGKIYANGLLILPAELEFERSLSIPMSNGIVKYMDVGNLKQSFGPFDLDADTFDNLESKTLVASFGPITVSNDVTGEMLKEKQITFISFGPISCHKNSLGYIKATATAFGPIEADDQ